MYCLNIALGNISWRLLFKEQENASIAFTKLEHAKLMKEPCYRIIDDFGQEFSGGDGIVALMLENLNETKMAHIEMALHQERTRIAATKAAQSDPGLKEALRPSGPGIINPMGNGFRPPGTV